MIEDDAVILVQAFEVTSSAGAPLVTSPERLYVTDSDANQLRVYGTTACVLLGTIDLGCKPAPRTSRPTATSSSPVPSRATLDMIIF